MKKINCCVTLFVFLFLYTSGFCQVSASGPTCVVPGITYQYKIIANWDSASTLQVCVTGGVIADTGSMYSCTPTGAPLYSVLVIWNDTSNASLHIVSSAGSSTLNVNITSPLIPGSIDTLTASQMIGHDSIPSAINCSIDTGGFCSPSYAYTWQQSTDNVSWTEMPGNTTQNLAFSSSISQTTFFRRKVTETQSGSIAYSNAATVFVIPTSQLNDTTQTDTTLTGFNWQRATKKEISLFIKLPALIFESAWLVKIETYFPDSKKRGYFI